MIRAVRFVARQPGHACIGLPVFTVCFGIASVAILTGSLADPIRESRIEDRDLTPELDDDIDHVIAALAAELDKLRSKEKAP